MENLIVWALKFLYTVVSILNTFHEFGIQRCFFLLLLRIKTAAVMCFYSERSGFIKCSSSQSFTCSWNTLKASQQSKNSQDNDDPWDTPVQISTKQLYLFIFIFFTYKTLKKVQLKQRRNNISMRKVTVVIIYKKTCKNVYSCII